MNSILNDRRFPVAVAAAVELVAMVLAAFAYRGLVAGGGLVDAFGWVGVGILVGLVWFGVSAALVWVIVGLLARRAVEGEVPRSRVHVTGRTLLAGYAVGGLVIAVAQAKFVATHPIEWTDMAFLNFATRLVVEVAIWPWTIVGFLGA